MSDELNTNFSPAVFPADIMYDSELNVYERIVLIVLFTYTNAHTRTVFPSYQTIADRAGIKKRAAITIVDRLIKKGYITKKTDFKVIKGSTIVQTSNKYTLTFKKRQADAPPPVFSMHPPQCIENTPPVFSMHPPSVFNAPELSNELSIGTEEEDKLEKVDNTEGNDEISLKNHQRENEGNTFPKRYLEIAKKVGATEEDVVVVLKKMDKAPKLKTPVAWFREALKNEVTNRELANRPKTEKKPASKRTEPRSTRAKADRPTTTSDKTKTAPEKYEKFYL